MSDMDVGSGGGGYRIELAKTGRAGCQDALCKREGIKIAAGELRLGAWVTIPGGHGGWKWSHWGCASGKKIQNLQNHLATGDKNDPYQWEMMDGYEELPDQFQEKFRDAIIAGVVAAEDFRGDPDFNIPGKASIRGRTKKPKPEEQDEGVAPDASQVPPSSAKLAKKKTAGKRGKKQADVEHDDNAKGSPVTKGRKKAAPKAAPKKRGKKAVKEVESEEEMSEEEESAVSTGGESESDEEMPALKKRGGRKAFKREDSDVSDSDAAPASSRRGKKALLESDDEDEEVMPIPKQRGTVAARKVKKEENEDEKPAVSKPAPRKRSKASVKKEEDMDDDTAVKPEATDNGRKRKVKSEEVSEDAGSSKVAPAAKKRQTARSVKKEKVKKEDSEDEQDDKDRVKRNINEEKEEDDSANASTLVKTEHDDSKKAEPENEDVDMKDIPASQPDTTAVRREDSEEEKEAVQEKPKKKVAKNKAKKPAPVQRQGSRQSSRNKV